MSVEELENGTLFGMGNPLLDVCGVTGDGFLTKYGLKPNDAILAGPEHAPLCDELAAVPGSFFVAGGSVQNAIRVTQWILNKPNVCTFMGCIGKDENGKILESKAKEAGVNTQYQLTEKQPTGTCGVVITQNGTCRSLVANLAAANCFEKSHIDVEANNKFMEQAKFYYISGFFLTVSPETIFHVAEHAAATNKVFTMNLSAPFVPQFYKDNLLKLIPSMDFLFGNETEAAALANQMKIEGDLKTVVSTLSLHEKTNKSRNRIVIITQGSDPALVGENGTVTEYPVTQLKPEQIVDSNGAGDAFVGGFLAQLIQGKDIPTCIRCGVWAATEIIQVQGCVCPAAKHFVL